MSTKGFPSQIAVQTATVSCQKSLYSLSASSGRTACAGQVRRILREFSNKKL